MSLPVREVGWREEDCGCCGDIKDGAGNRRGLLSGVHMWFWVANIKEKAERGREVFRVSFGETFRGREVPQRTGIVHSVGAMCQVHG